MSKRAKVLLVVLAAIALVVAGNLFLRFHLPPVMIRPEAIPGLKVGGVQVTNTLLTALLVDVILIVLAVAATRRMRLVPSGVQNFVEWVIETLYRLTESVAGAKWTPRFFAVVATIFLYVLVSNWFGLLPGLSAFGVVEEHAAHVAAAEASGVAEVASELAKEHVPRQVIIPLFRSPSTDLNNNFALALVAVLMTQVFGVVALGPRYFARFFNVKGLVEAVRFPPERGRRSMRGLLGRLAFGAIDFLVGILEAISEVAKVISFSFRLFGNIFAGEVMLLVLASLVPLVLTLPFLGLEVFVGLIQAFIFYILTLAFFTVATASHGHEEREQSGL
ncbi:MAG: F0F1 ATP synthase subunit A [candidate division KSB1 bacterium]|nr:F0F1 ATP synthase subunit A [candidate division KSB1 bacterium]